MRKKTTVAMLGVVIVALCLFACSAPSSDQDADEPIYLHISDATSSVADATDGNSELRMDFTVTNVSKTRSARMEDLPELALDDMPIETDYEFQDSSKRVLDPGEIAYGHVDYDYDEKTEHEWRFDATEGTVVSGLERYVSVVEAERDYEGKDAITMEEIEKIDAEEQVAYEEYLVEEAEEEAERAAQGE